MKNLATETRLDVIYRTLDTSGLDDGISTLAHLIENNLREYDLYHAMKAWQQGV